LKATVLSIWDKEYCGCWQ